MRTEDRPPGPSHWDVVLHAWEHLDLPEGWRAEIIDGDLVLTDPHGEREGPPPVWDVVLHAWERLDLPEGWEADIVDHGIHVRRVPEGTPALVLAELCDRLAASRSPFGEGGITALHAPAHRFDVRVPELGFLASPDLSVPNGGPPGNGVHGAGVHLVAEVASGSGDSAGDDVRAARLRGYAHAQIPLYLLVDRWDPATGRGEVTLFSEPEHGTYTSVVKVPFGKEIHLPEPFDLTLDTSGFPA